MITIHYVTADGTRHSVSAAPGASLMQAAVQNGVPGIVGECGGAAMCATCHVYLEPGAPVPPRAAIEDEMLDCAAAEVTATSRLACQVVLDAALDGLVVHLPDSQH